jgi:hypothetical protein
MNIKPKFITLRRRQETSVAISNSEGTLLGSGLLESGFVPQHERIRCDTVSV